MWTWTMRSNTSSTHECKIYEGALVAHRQAVSISKVQTEPSCYWQAWATTLHPADSARFHVDDSTKKKWTLHSAQLRELLQMLPQDSKCQILQRICPDYLMRQWTWRWVLSKRTSPVFFLYRTQKYSIVNGFRFCVMSPPVCPATRQPLDSLASVAQTLWWRVFGANTVCQYLSVESLFRWAC